MYVSLRNSYVFACYPYVNNMSLGCIPITLNVSFVSGMLPVCHAYLLVF